MDVVDPLGRERRLLRGDPDVEGKNCVENKERELSVRLAAIEHSVIIVAALWPFKFHPTPFSSFPFKTSPALNEFPPGGTSVTYTVEWPNNLQGSINFCGKRGRRKPVSKSLCCVRMAWLPQIPPPILGQKFVARLQVRR